MASLEIIPEPLDESFVYEANNTVSKKAHFEWTINNFNWQNSGSQLLQIPFFLPGSGTKYKSFFQVVFTIQISENDIYFTFTSEEFIYERGILDISFSLKSLDHVHEFAHTCNYEGLYMSGFDMSYDKFKDCFKWDPRDPAARRDLTIIYSVNLTIERVIPREVNAIENVYISDHRNSILKKEIFHDFTIIVQCKIIHVSKAVLALESPIFASLCEFQSNVLLVNDSDSGTFMKMIEFIYNRKLSQDDLEQLVFPLWILSHMYKVKSLSELCVTFLHDKISVNNVFVIVGLAHFFAHLELKEKALRFIKLNFELFRESESFLVAISIIPDFIMDLLMSDSEL